MNLYELVRTPGDFPRRPATSSELCQRSQGWADLDKLRLKTLTRLMNLMSLRSLGSAQFLYKGLPHVATAEAPGPDCKETWASLYAPHNWVGPTWMINEEPWMKNLQKSFVLEGAMLPLDSLRLGGNSTVCFLQLFVLYLFFPSQHVIFTFFLSFRFSMLLSHYPFCAGKSCDCVERSSGIPPPTENIRSSSLLQSCEST